MEMPDDLRTDETQPSAPALPKRFFLPVIVLVAAIAAALTAFAIVAQQPEAMAGAATAVTLPSAPSSADAMPDAASAQPAK